MWRLWCSLSWGSMCSPSLMIRGTFVPLAELPALPALKKRWPVQAAALSLVQNSNLQTLVDFCLPTAFTQGSFDLGRRNMLLHTFLKVSNNVACVWPQLNLTEKQTNPCMSRKHLIWMMKSWRVRTPRAGMLMINWRLSRISWILSVTAFSYSKLLLAFNTVQKASIIFDYWMMTTLWQRINDQLIHRYLWEVSAHERLFFNSSELKSWNKLTAYHHRHENNNNTCSKNKFLV